MDTTYARKQRRCAAAAAAAAAAVMLPCFSVPALADSHTQERSIGQQVFNDLQKRGQIVYESPYYPVLRAVGQRISDAAQPHWYPMNFIIVKGSAVNAFSVPGGNVYVNEGLLRAAENEDELASVLGHETGHLVLGHVMNRIHKAEMYNIGLGILGLFIHSQGQANLADIIANYTFLNFSRQQEYQADHQGVILAARAGYNPWGMIWFFQKLKKLSGNSGFEQYVEDHPSTNDRIARIRAFMQGDAAAFGKWRDAMPAPSNGLPTAGTNTRLVLH